MNSGFQHDFYLNSTVTSTSAMDCCLLCNNDNLCHMFDYGDNQCVFFAKRDVERQNSDKAYIVATEGGAAGYYNS